jgi:hypothetical protein
MRKGTVENRKNPNFHNLCFRVVIASVWNFLISFQRSSKRAHSKSHHRLAIARLAAAAIERVLEAIWTIQNEIWYYTIPQNKLSESFSV